VPKSTANLEPQQDAFETTTRQQSNHNPALLAAAAAGATPALVTLFTSLPADAADGGSFFPIASALVAYVHYASLLVTCACLVTERLTVKADMSEEEERRLVFADSVYGIAGLALFVSGYYRVTEYGKGIDFYLHEPVFWVKMILVAVWGASSFFPTAIIIKRAVQERNTGSFPPMSEKLAARMTTIINAELLALISMPLAATLMSRGVLYSDDIPWQIGASLTVLTLGGLGYKYIKEALTWEEDDATLVEAKE
jgi:uncharacterized membrane protein